MIAPILARVDRSHHWAILNKRPAHLKEPLGDAQVQDHLNGGAPRGACPIRRGESTTRLALLDLDSHKGESTPEQMADAAGRLAVALDGRGLRAIPFRSSGGSGMHLYMLWRAPQDAYSVRAAIGEALTECGFSNGTGGVAADQVEIFPKQDSVPADRWGSMFVLPLAGRSCPLDPETFEPTDHVDWRASEPVAVRERPKHEATAAAPAGTDDARLLELLADHDPDASYEDWLRVGMALHHETGGGGFALWDDWSAQSPKYPGSEKLMTHWQSFGHHPNPVTLGSLRVEKPADVDDFEVVEVETKTETKQPSEPPLFRFYAYLPSHQYMDRHTRSLWPAPSIDGHLKGIVIDGMKPSAWLDKNRHVDQMTWMPEHDEIIRDRIVAEGGWLKREGMQVYNTYLAPPIAPGDPAQAAPWLAHLERVYPNDREHMLHWFAHRVQRPGDKINHALVIGGGQGIGKETLLEPVKVAVGSWNWNEIAPHQMLGRFNSWCKSVVVRVNEARDLGDVDRFGFYDRSKNYIAAPPDVIRIDEKHTREYYVPNVMGVIITTNDKLSGIYLPADDRRHYVAWSELDKSEFADGYWNELWSWYKRGGFGHVAAYLRALDLSNFDSKAPPPKTDTFYRIVEAGAAPEESGLTNLLAEMGNPPAVTVDQLRAACAMSTDDELTALFERRKARALPHKLERAGYESHRNPGDKAGRWKIGGRQMIVYVRKELRVPDRFRAAQALIDSRAERKERKEREIPLHQISDLL